MPVLAAPVSRHRSWVLVAAALLGLVAAGGLSPAKAPPDRSPARGLAGIVVPLIPEAAAAPAIEVRIAANETGASKAPAPPAVPDPPAAEPADEAATPASPGKAKRKSGASVGITVDDETGKVRIGGGNGSREFDSFEAVAREAPWIAGLVFLAIFLGTFQYVLEEGAKNDWFADAEIRNLAAVSLIAGFGFFWRTLTRPTPIVDLSPFANRSFAISTLLAFMVGVGLFGITYLLPLYLGRIQGYSSMQIGDTLWVTGLFMFFTAPLMGVLANRVDLRYLAFAGFVFLGVSAWMLSDLTTETTYWDLFIPQALRGMGLMTTMMGVQTIAIQSLSPQQVKGASGLFNLMRNTGGAFGLALLNTGLVDRTNLHWQHFRETLIAGNPQAEAFLEGFAARYADQMPGGDAEMAALKILSQITFQQASVLAFNDLFLMLAAGFAVTMTLLLVLGKPVNRLAEEMH